MSDQQGQLRVFVIERLRDIADAKGVSLPDLVDDVDLLEAGLVDSMGFVELIAAAEGHLGREVDLSGRDLDQFTTLGGFVRVLAAA